MYVSIHGTEKSCTVSHVCGNSQGSCKLVKLLLFRGSSIEPLNFIKVFERLQHASDVL